MLLEKDFFQKIGEVYIPSQKLIILTITDVKDKAKLDLIGAKVLLRENNEPIFSNNKLNFLDQSLKETGDYEKILKIDNPLLKWIKTTGGLELEVYLEPLFDKPRLIIFGAGHVSQSLTKIGRMIDYEVMVIDDREDWVNRKRFPEADYLICEKFKTFLHDFEVKPNDYLIIVTRGHEFDYFILKDVIKSKAKYIGMIGSLRKVQIIFEKLKNEAEIDQSLIDRVYAPIGFEIGAETPEEIAISIAAELINVRRENNG